MWTHIQHFSICNKNFILRYRIFDCSVSRRYKMISQFTWPNFHGGSAEEGTRVSLSYLFHRLFSFCPCALQRKSYLCINFHGGSAEEGTRVSLSLTFSIAYSLFVPVHCNENPILYSFSGNCATSVPISTFMCMSVSDLCISRVGPHIFLQKNGQIDRGNI
jgi:hypothetical protein